MPPATVSCLSDQTAAHRHQLTIYILLPSCYLIVPRCAKDILSLRFCVGGGVQIRWIFLLRSYGPVRLIPYSACSASFFSRNSVFSHNNSAGTVFFSQISDQRTGPIHVKASQKNVYLVCFLVSGTCHAPCKLLRSLNTVWFQTIC